jgi:hypothetical protein
MNDVECVLVWFNVFVWFLFLFWRERAGEWEDYFSRPFGTRGDAKWWIRALKCRAIFRSSLWD